MVAGHLQEKRGTFYMVLNYKDDQGNRKTRWIPTGLAIKGNKKRAEAMLLDTRKRFQPEVTHTYKSISGDMLFTDYLKTWLQVAKSTIRTTTYSSYDGHLKSCILPYFEKTGIKLGDLQAKDIQLFYALQLERVSANTVIHYHAVIHRALKYAVKVDLIPGNPADKVDRPKKERFVGSFYDQEQVNRLFNIVKGHPIEIPVMLAVFYGLRRSEIIGLKWSAIDLKENTLLIQHTVTTCSLDGKCVEIATDMTKNQSSLRTLPLVPYFREKLIEAARQQMEDQAVGKRSYCKDFLDYVCVTKLGKRMRPDYVTSAFRNLLIKNGMPVIRFHDLRHTCASLLLANKAELTDIKDWLGHSDFSTTANIYAHLDYKAKQTSAEKMTSCLGLELPVEAEVADAATA